MWDIEYDYIEDWLDLQDTSTVATIFAAFEVLQQEGPALGRPLVDTLKGTEVSNLKELRPSSPDNSEIRILFAFDLVRHAVMLLAGNKASGKRTKDKWSGWYKKAIPQAEKLFEKHQNALTSSIKEED